MTEPATPVDPSEPGDAELMARYGITRVPADRFHYKTYRYTSLGEALAQARRDASPS